MGPNQLFQRLVLLEQNDYWIGGQPWHGDLLSPLRIRHATTQPIRLLKTLHPRWSQNFRSDVLGILPALAYSPVKRVESVNCRDRWSSSTASPAAAHGSGLRARRRRIAPAPHRGTADRPAACRDARSSLRRGSAIRSARSGPVVRRST